MEQRSSGAGHEHMLQSSKATADLRPQLRYVYVQKSGSESRADVSDRGASRTVSRALTNHVSNAGNN